MRGNQVSQNFASERKRSESYRFHFGRFLRSGLRRKKEGNYRSTVSLLAKPQLHAKQNRISLSFSLLSRQPIKRGKISNFTELLERVWRNNAQVYIEATKVHWNWKHHSTFEKSIEARTKGRVRGIPRIIIPHEYGEGNGEESHANN